MNHVSRPFSFRRGIVVAAPLSSLVGGVLCLAPQSNASALQQSRSLFSWVSINGCPSQTANASAADFDHFNETIGVSPKCALGDSSASASQNSKLAATRFIAQSATNVDAQAENRVVHAMGRSTYDITFELSSARSFRLTGSISAENQAAQIVDSRVTLSQGGSNIVHALVDASPNQSETMTINESGVLQAGTYRLYIQSNAFIDAFFQPGHVSTGLATHDAKLTLGPVVAGDVTGDGIVNVMDLLVVLNNWGVCGNTSVECIGDIAPHGGDGLVNVSDLLEIIGKWGNTSK